jgi:hypothetical protein
LDVLEDVAPVADIAQSPSSSEISGFVGREHSVVLSFGIELSIRLMGTAARFIARIPWRSEGAAGRQGLRGR